VWTGDAAGAEGAGVEVDALMEIKDGGPAFPHEQHGDYDKPGMSLRDYFAAQALTVVASVEAPTLLTRGRTAEDMAGFIARVSYLLADAMLAARDAR
jgi:hypothetical protein